MKRLFALHIVARHVTDTTVAGVRRTLLTTCVDSSDHQFDDVDTWMREVAFGTTTGSRSAMLALLMTA